MKVTERTRRVLAARRQKRDLARAGYRHLPEIDWRLNRGEDRGKSVTDVVIGADGNSLFYRVAA